MRLRILLLFSVLLLTACSKAPVEELAKPEQNAPAESSSATQPNPTSAAANKTTGTNDSGSEPVSAAVPQPNAEAIAAAERTKAAQAELAKIQQRYKAAFSDWVTKLRSSKTAEARDLVRLASPGDEFAKMYCDLADKSAGTPVALESLIGAIKIGKEETKQLASHRLLELAQMDAGTIEAERTLMMVAQHGGEEAQQKASLILADLVAKDPASATAQRLIPAMLQVRTDSAGKDQVAQLLLDQADQNAGTDQALDSLVLVASRMSGKTKSAALSKISEHHLQSESILDLIKKVTSGRTPDEAAENWLKDLCRNPSGTTVKGVAAIALTDVVDRRKTYRSIVQANEEARSKLSEEVLAYLDREPDADELELIETTLDGYISTNESLLETAKSKLFVVKNLSIGKNAPEISGMDLDGVDFKLSDYRGKVVFLDFWGDW